MCWILFFRLNFNLPEWILLSMVCGSIEVHLQQGTLFKDFFFIWILSKFVKPSKPKLSDAIILTGQKLVYIKRLSIEINFWLLQVNSGILYGWRQNSASKFCANKRLVVNGVSSSLPYYYMRLATVIRNDFPFNNKKFQSKHCRTNDKKKHFCSLYCNSNIIILRFWAILSLPNVVGDALIIIKNTFTSSGS